MVTKTDKYLNKFVASQTAGDVKVLVQAPGFEYRFESENALPMHFIASSTKLRFLFHEWNIDYRIAN